MHPRVKVWLENLSYWADLAASILLQISISIQIDFKSPIKETACYCKIGLLPSSIANSCSDPQEKYHQDDSKLSIGLYGIDQNEGVVFIGFDKSSDSKNVIIDPVAFGDKIGFDTTITTSIRFDPVDTALIMNHPFEGIVKVSWEHGFHFPMSSAGVKKEKFGNIYF